MTGVNDLEQFFRVEWDEPLDCSAVGYSVADRIKDVALSAWHPVSDPPTKEDGDKYGMVLVCYPDKTFNLERIVHWGLNYDDPNDESVWARIRDVVLLPEE